jgi:hypothetical protein
VLSGLAKGLGALTDHWDNQVKMKRQAAADARENYRFNREVTTDAATDDTLATMNRVQNNTLIAPPVAAPAGPAAPPTQDAAPVLDGADIASVDKTVSRLETMQAAVDQGKMPSLSRNAQIDLARNQLFDKYSGRPGALEEVAKIFKDKGIDLFPDITAEQKFRSAEQESRTKEYFDTIEVAKKLKPYDPNTTDEEYYRSGREFQAREAARIAAKNISDERRAAAAEERAARGEERESIEFGRKEESLDAFSDGQTQMFNTMGPVLQDFLKLAQSGPGIGQNAEYETKMANLTAHLHSTYNAVRSSIVRSAKDPVTASQLAARLDDEFKTVILDPIVTRRVEFGKAAEVLGTAFKLRMQEAAPLIRQLNSIGIDMKDMPDVVQNLSPELKAQVAKELAFSMNPKLSADVGKIHTMHALEMLKGNTSLRDMTTTQARQALTSEASRHVMGLAPKIARGEGNGEMWLNAAAQMPTAAVSVNSGSGPAVLGRAMAVLANNNSINALNKLMSNPDTSEKAKLVAQSSRAGVAHIMQETRTAAGATARKEYQGIYYDRGQGQYVLRFSDREWKKAYPNVYTPGNIPSSMLRNKPSAPSADLQKLVGNMNAGLKYLVATTKWDAGSAPTGGWKDVAEFYAVGDTAGTSYDSKSPQRKKDADVIKAIDALDKSLGDPSRFLVPADSPSDGTSRGERNNNPGNLEYGAYTKGKGATGTDGRFAVFPTMEAGVKAQEELLVNNYINKGRNTVTKVLEKYAPRSDNQGSFENYVSYVAKRLNINPNDTLTPAIVGRLAQAMREFETGNTRRA